MAKIAQLIEAGDYLVYKGDWVTNTSYNVNEVVTWADDGQLYEVIKVHTSSDTLKPGNTEYYKAMTATKYYSKTYQLTNNERRNIVTDVKNALNTNRRAFCYINQINGFTVRLNFTEIESTHNGVIANGIHRDQDSFYPAILQLFITQQVSELSNTIVNNTGVTKSYINLGTVIKIYYEA